MDDTPQVVDTRTLKFLRVLVTVLTATMIVGVLVIITLLVIRLQTSPPPLPERISLPEGTKAVAFTQSETWYAVVTEDDRILIYSPDTGALVQDIEIMTGE